MSGFELEAKWRFGTFKDMCIVCLILCEKDIERMGGGGGRKRKVAESHTRVDAHNGYIWIER